MLNKLKLLSVKAKITLAITASSLLLSILAIGIIYFYLTAILIDENVYRTNSLINEQVRHSTQIIKINQVFARMLATHVHAKDFLLDNNEEEGKELLGMFSVYAKADSKYMAIYLLDTHGVALISTDPRFVGQDYSFRDYFKKAMAGEPAVDTAIGKTSNQFGYYFSHPVKSDDGAAIGVLVVKVDNTEIDNSILSGELVGLSTVMLVDNFGVVLVSNRTDRFLKSLGPIAPENVTKIIASNKLLGKEVVPLQYSEAQRVIEDFRGTVTIDYYDPVDHEDEVITLEKFEQLPFFLVTEIGMDVVEEGVLVIILKVISIFLLGIVLSSFLIYRAIVSLIRPLSQFASVAEAIDKGDFSKKVEITTKDEFGELAETFNTMTTSLGETISAMEAKDKSLESKIKERTEDYKRALEQSEKLNKFMIGRELKMIELKKEVARLMAKSEDK